MIETLRSVGLGVCTCTTALLALGLSGCGTRSGVPPASAEGTRPPVTRAMWCWNGSEIAGDPAREEAFLAFCTDVEVTAVFIDCVQALRSDRHQAVRGLIERAHGESLRLLALYGAPTWALRDQHDEALAAVSAVLAFNQAGTRPQRFDGLQFDVEPYLIADFDEQHARILPQYLEMCRKIVGSVEAEAPDLEVGFAIPFWLDDEHPDVSEVSWKGTVKPTTFHLVDLLGTLPTSHVAVMAYRDYAGDGSDNGSIAHSQQEVRYVAEHDLGVDVWVGQETGEVKPPDPPTISFFGKTWGDLQVEVQKIDAAFVQFPSYRGVALHHYTALRELKGSGE